MFANFSLSFSVGDSYFPLNETRGLSGTVIRAIKNSINFFYHAAGRAVVVVVNQPRCDAPFFRPSPSPSFFFNRYTGRYNRCLTAASPRLSTPQSSAWDIRCIIRAPRISLSRKLRSGRISMKFALRERHACSRRLG